MTQAPSFFQGVSFRLAKIGIILAFVLGLLMSSFQLYLDLRNQRSELNELFHRVLEVATPPAVRAVHTLDDDLSAEVVNGLLAYDFVTHVQITDDLGNTLAKGESKSQPSGTRWITRLFNEENRRLETDLSIPGYDESATGKLAFTVNMDQALAGFYERSMLNLVTGLARNALLVLLLFFAFYFIVTKPLVRLAREIKNIDPEEPGVKRLTPLRGRKDELAQLVDSGNQLLNAMELSLAKRRAGGLALRKSEEHLRQLIDSLPVLVGGRDEQGRYLFANQTLAALLDSTPGQMREQSARELLVGVVDDVELVLENDQRVIRQGIDIEINEEAFVTPDGRTLYLQTHILPVRYYDEVIALSVSVDITDRKKAQAEMEFMAHHDALTHLPNRVQLVERLDFELRRASRHGYCGAVLFIDLDQFKNINDSLGHPVGDRVLKEVAKRLVSSVREEDMIARLSGDEFVVLLTVLDEDMATAALKAGEVGEKIRHIISRPFLTEGLELRTSCSVGVALFPDKDNSAHELLRYADTAMYQVKEKGRDAIEFFNEEMADKVSRQLLMEGDLHRALEENQFTLHYQPKVDVGTGQVVGAEALLRWHHPDKGMISPADFIPILETSGLILDVGQWVLETACETLVHWQAHGWWKRGMRLSINISPRQFRRAAFTEDVLSTLERHAIPKNSLEMEVTEGIVIQDVEEAIVTMECLAEHGISFSLDDFGTGYSSISYLKQLPVSVLKIDQSFIRDIIDDRSDRVLVETIITMGRLLDLDVIAEGVEEEAQFDLLQKYGCHYFQGFYFSPGVELEVFDAMLAEAADKEP
ncbi:putative bifunctional diguanylate cyclase/phosphodiesterase [Marinimicrobium locisalis]|uniref:putative bifunctional diguanylate cyclase/phosphodiesterase n=1 Tax=Marinimicrobium locisalis TaxID=546022 RepID=UPI00322199CF